MRVRTHLHQVETMITGITYKEISPGIYLVKWLDKDDNQHEAETSFDTFIDYIIEWYQYDRKYAEAVFSNVPDIIIDNYIKDTYK